MGSGRYRVRFRARADCHCFIVKTEGKVRFSGSVGVVRGSFSDRFRIVLGSLSDHFRTVFRTVFGSFWDMFGMAPGSFPALFRNFCLAHFVNSLFSGRAEAGQVKSPTPPTHPLRFDPGKIPQLKNALIARFGNPSLQCLGSPVFAVPCLLGPLCISTR